ncbi:MAG: tetraprenyl-beta-curcumene synthase family protein [Syntrophomonadaceae bacterium]|nr:tetraprenyl-beta-curcumene synthase family protein [Syntrophomonadaceae bacterium]
MNFSSDKMILADYIFRVLPRVKKLLRYWELEALCIPDPVLKTQALESLALKAFHCQGGAVYASPWRRMPQELLDFIVAYQTLCDYLDNLCDRAGSTDGQAFSQLHRSLFDALHPSRPLDNYYKYYPKQDDGGYINKLVNTCQASLANIPDYHLIQDQASLLAESYSELQVKKHLAIEFRHEELCTWAQHEAKGFQEILWPEYAAACGSTLAIFALLKAAVIPGEMTKNQVQLIYCSYFPWICGLHILLDYFIDRDEDRAGGDLNFTFYYENDQFMQQRLEKFTRQSMICAEKMPQATFHRIVVKGLLAMYLSDAKVAQQGYGRFAEILLNSAGSGAWSTYHLCRTVRRFL